MELPKAEYDINNPTHVTLLRRYQQEKKEAGGWWEFLATKGLYNLERRAVNFSRIKEVNFFEEMDKALSRLIVRDINACKAKGIDWLSPETRRKFNELRDKMKVIGANKK